MSPRGPEAPDDAAPPKRARARRSLRAWLRPPRTLKVTPSGRTFLILTLGVGLGALNTGNNLLYLVLGLQLATIVVSGLLSERVLRHLELRRLGADAAFAQEPFTFRWALRARGGRAYALTVSERTPSLEGEGRLGVLPANEERIVRGTLSCAQRGPLTLTEVAITTTFPLGLFAKTRVLRTTPELLLVYPRRRPDGGRPPEGAHGPLGTSPDPRRVDGQGEPAGLRPLRDGEPARGVHWMKSAARGALLKVEREREERHAYELTLAALQGTSLDRECERLAALAAALIGQGHEVGLITAQRKLRPAVGPRQLTRVLQALAWAGHEEPAP